MRYYVHLADKPTEVDVVELPSGALEVRLDGTPIEVDVSNVPGALSVRVDGRIVDLTTEGEPPDLGILASGTRSYIRVESERMRAAGAAKKGPSANDRLLRSPMPGRVVKVCVASGDVVEAGAPLVVVEAMKMENELRAKARVTIADVLVKAGDAVEGNAKLVTFT